MTVFNTYSGYHDVVMPSDIDGVTIPPLPPPPVDAFPDWQNADFWETGPIEPSATRSTIAEFKKAYTGLVDWVQGFWRPKSRAASPFAPAAPAAAGGGIGTFILIGGAALILFALAAKR